MKTLFNFLFNPLLKWIEAARIEQTRRDIEELRLDLQRSKAMRWSTLGFSAQFRAWAEREAARKQIASPNEYQSVLNGLIFKYQACLIARYIGRKV